MRSESGLSAHSIPHHERFHTLMAKKLAKKKTAKKKSVKTKTTLGTDSEEKKTKGNKDSQKKPAVIEEEEN
mgnify:CR=1 FL=1